MTEREHSTHRLASPASILVAIWLTISLVPSAEAAGELDPARWFSDQEIERAAAFQRTGFLLSAATLAAKVVLLFALYAGRHSILRALGGLRTKRWYAQVAAWALLVAVLMGIVNTASGAIKYRRHLAVGLTEQPASDWLRDTGKLRLRGTVMTVLVTVGVYAFIGLLGRRWWWTGALALVMTIRLSSALLTTHRDSALLYEYQRLPAGPLRSHLESLIARSGHRVTGIRVALTSRLSTRANAWIGTFGREHHLVLTDTLVERYTPNEIGIIAAHEMGHLREWILAKHFVRGLCRYLAAVAVAQLLLVRAARRAGVRFGLPEPVPLWPASLILSSILWGPFGKQLTKRSEIAANRYAVELTQDPDTFITVQKRIAIENLSPLHPPWIVRALFLSHPSPVEAMAEAERRLSLNTQHSLPSRNIALTVHPNGSLPEAGAIARSRSRRPTTRIAGRG